LVLISRVSSHRGNFCGGQVVRFYNKRGTAEQWIKEGKQAVKMTRLNCHRFRSNEVRLWLSVIDGSQQWAFATGKVLRAWSPPRALLGLLLCRSRRSHRTLDD
jgi:hypothetical protein